MLAASRRPPLPLTEFHRRFGGLATEDDLIRVERVISFARVLVSAIALLAIWLDPPEPARYAPITYMLAATYVVASVLALLWLRRRPTFVRGEALVLHAQTEELVLYPAAILVGRHVARSLKI